MPHDARKVKIPVIWHAEHLAPGIYNCTAMVGDMFNSYDCVHFPGWYNMPAVEGAVVVVHGGRERGRLETLNSDIQKLKWVLLIFLGDEEASFPAEQVLHPNKKVWVQEPLPGRHDFVDRFILDGYTPHTRKHTRDKNIVTCKRDLDWVFAGQVTHERRRACVTALQGIPWGGVIVESKGYCQGVSLEEYYRLLCRAKIAPCPSGPCSPDSARVSEALECGAIPILDDLSPTRKEPGFWKYVLGEYHPLPIISDWSLLPLVIDNLKENFTEKQDQCLSWWRRYLSDFETWLGKDMEELRDKTESACRN